MVLFLGVMNYLQYIIFKMFLIFLFFLDTAISDQLYCLHLQSSFCSLCCICDDYSLSFAISILPIVLFIYFVFEKCVSVLSVLSCFLIEFLKIIFLKTYAYPSRYCVYKQKISEDHT